MRKSLSGVSGSGYTDLDRTTDPGEYIARLDLVGSTDFWRSIKQLTYQLLKASPGHRILDVGCGTGDDARALAALVAPGGCAVGVDLSAAMVAEACARSTGSGEPVEFHSGDANHLELADSSFDGCRAERLLQHLDQPGQALDEMIRVTRPGGRVVVVEPDYGTLSVQGADAAVTRVIVGCRLEHFRSGRIGSQLPRFFKERGLVDIAVTIRRLSSSDPRTDHELLRKYASGAEIIGAISASAATGWLSDLEAAGVAGAYAHSIAVFVLSATRP